LKCAYICVEKREKREKRERERERDMRPGSLKEKPFTARKQILRKSAFI